MYYKTRFTKKERGMWERNYFRSSSNKNPNTWERPVTLEVTRNEILTQSLAVFVVDLDEHRLSLFFVVKSYSTRIEFEISIILYE